MDQRSLSQAKLLCIPTEIRVKILKLSIGEHTVHVRSMRHESYTVECAHRPKMDSGHAQSDQFCNHKATMVKPSPGLTAVCRLLFDEANDILYHQTILSFSSSQVLLDFFSRQKLALRSARCIRLHCGPAKHSSKNLKQLSKSALTFLVCHAASLSELHLQFGMYYGIRLDRHLFSNFWYHKLCDTYLSSRFRLLLEFDVNLPGPVGNVVESEIAKQQIEAKMYYTGKTIHTLLSTLTGQCGRVVKMQVHQLQRESTLSASKISLPAITNLCFEECSNL